MVSLVYCIDTSAILEGWERRYCPDVFPGIWGKFDELISEKRLIAPREVSEEAGKKGSSELKNWLGDRSEVFFELDEDEQMIMRRVLGKHTHLVKEIKRRTAADPYIIAMAVHRQLTVVTMELRTGNLSKPRIPDVLDDPEFSRPCVNLFEMMQTEKWVFR